MEMGVNLTPKYPATPIPIIEDSAMITNVANVAANERMMSQVSMNMTTNISGISVAPSFIPVSAKALLSMDTPVR